MSSSSAEIFDLLGVWEQICARPTGHYNHMQVWDQVGGGYCRLGSRTTDSVLGYVVEDRLLSSVLWEKLLQLAASRSEDPAAGTLQLLCPEALGSVVFGEDGADGSAPWPQLCLESGETLRGRLLIDASGGGSRLRTQAGFRCVSTDYQQNAVPSLRDSTLQYNNQKPLCITCERNLDIFRLGFTYVSIARKTDDYVRNINR